MKILDVRFLGWHGRRCFLVIEVCLIWSLEDVAEQRP